MLNDRGLLPLPGRMATVAEDSAARENGAASIDDEAYEEARIVEEDLRHLHESWTPEVSEAQIRRESPILRRLLVDEAYGRSWRRLGLPREPIVIASDLKTSMGQLDVDCIGVAVAELPFQPFPDGLGVKSEAKFKTTRGAPKGSVLMFEASKRGRFMTTFVSPEDVGDDSDAIVRRYRSQIGDAVDRCFWLTEYLSSPAVFIEGVWFSRRDIVKYISNRRGGSHYGMPVPRAERIKFTTLDNTHARIGDLPVVHLQLLAISHVICKSSDAFRFQERFRALPARGDPFG